MTNEMKIKCYFLFIFFACLYLHFSFRGVQSQHFKYVYIPASRKANTDRKHMQRFTLNQEGAVLRAVSGRR